MWTLILLPLATLVLAWLASQITPAFVARYMAPILASILLLAAWGAARSGVAGLVAIVLSVVFVTHLSSYTPQNKSDMRDDQRRGDPAAAPGRRRAFGSAGPAAARLVLPPGLAAQYVTAPRHRQGPELHGLGVRAQATAGQPARQQWSIRSLLAWAPANSCCSCGR